MASKASSGGVSFAGLLTITFVVLKLIGVINWSWIWVLAPLWISLGIAVILLIVLAILFKNN
jgi:hypothetical protein